MDTTRILRPLDEAGPWIDRLESYHSSAELSSALQATWQGVDRTLRNLLRSDVSAPDELRLAALSSEELPHDRLIPALRQRNLISLQLAGLIHELEVAARRATEGATRPTDADNGLKVVELLRAEVGALSSDRPVAAAAHNAVETGRLDMPAHDVPPPRRGAFIRLYAPALTIVTVAVLTVLVVARDSDLDKGIAAFQAEQWPQAERYLSAAAKDGDATAQLYLARVYRSTRQFDRAAAVLRQAAADHPDDDDVLRELGKLFLDLGRPQQAVERLQRARELDPKDNGNWVWLIHALRSAGDPSAERVLQDAPDEVRATLSRTR